MGTSSGIPAELAGLVLRRWGSRGIVLSVLSTCLGLPHAAAQPFQDITSQVTITKSGLVLNRATNTFNTVVTITNTSGTAISGPLVLNVSAVTPASVTLANAADQGPSGNPYVTLTVPATGLSPRASISNVLLAFSDPSKAGFTFTLSVAVIVAPFATANATGITFHSPAGGTVLTIPLVNQSVVTATPQGNVTNVTSQVPIISDDGSHAGVYTSTYSFNPGDTDGEPLVAGTFTYYAASGQLWQATAPLGPPFILPIDPFQRFITPDGSPVLVIAADTGKSDPVLTVYDQTGNLLYQSAGSFLEFYQAQISPNGIYLLVLGTVKSNNAYQDLITVTDLVTGASSSLPVNLGAGAVLAISISGDGRFLISYQGTQMVLPSA